MTEMVADKQMDKQANNEANSWNELFQTFRAAPGQAYCFSFSYHMFGTDIGELRAIVLTNISHDSLSSEAILWKLSGDNGNQWQDASVNVSTLYTSQPFQVKEKNSFI